MKPFFCVVLLSLVTTSVLGQPAHQSRASNPPSGPEVVVRSLYGDVIAYHPIGIPREANMKRFAPYLSKSLIHRIDLVQACSKDWMRQNQGQLIKAPFAWGEAGLFSGDDEKALPGSFRIEKTKAETDGSFRVDVELTYRPSDGPGVWHVEVIVARDGGHLTVDDVIFLKSKDSSPLAPNRSRLSEILSQGCDGPRWVGYGNQHR